MLILITLSYHEIGGLAIAKLEVQIAKVALWLASVFHKFAYPTTAVSLFRTYGRLTCFPRVTASVQITMRTVSTRR